MGTLSIFLKLAMPFFLRRLGTLTVFRWCMRSWAATFAAMALLPVVAQRGGAAAEWAAVSGVLFLSRIGCMAFSCVFLFPSYRQRQCADDTVGAHRIIMILTKDHTPGTSSLGTANGMAEFAQSLAGVFAPTIVRYVSRFPPTGLDLPWLRHRSSAYQLALRVLGFAPRHGWLLLGDHYGVRLCRLGLVRRATQEVSR